MDCTRGCMVDAWPARAPHAPRTRPARAPHAPRTRPARAPHAHCTHTARTLHAHHCLRFPKACRGILTTLHALGLHEEVAARDLGGLRRWYARQGGEMLSDKVLRLARVKYVVTSHDPFDAQQAAGCLAPPPQPPRYRASLVLDRLLEADWEAVRAGLRAAGEPCSLDGVASLLRRSCVAMHAEFLSAATPHTFCYEAPAEGAAPFTSALGEGAQPTAQQANAYYYYLGRSANQPAALRPSTLRVHCTCTRTHAACAVQTAALQPCDTRLCVRACMRTARCSTRWCCRCAPS